jgi:hypothetical protein
MIDIVDESDARDFCRGFPPFAPFPPVVFLTHPKGALQLSPAWHMLSLAASSSATMSLSATSGVAETFGAIEQGADDRGVGDGAVFVHRVGEVGAVAIQFSTVRGAAPKEPASTSLAAPSRQ